MTSNFSWSRTVHYNRVWRYFITKREETQKMNGDLILKNRFNSRAKLLFLFLLFKLFFFFCCKHSGKGKKSLVGLTSSDFWLSKIRLETILETNFERSSLVNVSKAALRRAFYACVYCMRLRFQGNYVGWLKPR